MASSLRLLVATDRAGLAWYFRGLPTGDRLALEVSRLPLDVASVRAIPDLADAAVAVVDVDSDHADVLRTIDELHSRRRDLPVIALLASTQAATPSALRELSHAGVKGMLDLHATPEQTWETIQAAAAGNVVIQLRLEHGSRGLRQILTGEGVGSGDGGVRLNTLETRILQLLGEGAGDQEMASRLFLSPHTIKHRVEQLRAKVGARNRIALAAWAGRHGFAEGEELQQAAEARR